MPVAVVVAIGLFLVADRSSPGPASAEPSHSRSGPLPTVTVSPVPHEGAADHLCPRLLAALPDELGHLALRQVDARDQYFRAWGDPAAIVRCGVPRPAKFVVGAGLQQVDSVQWFEDGPTWTAADRQVYVSVRVPDGGDTTGLLVDVGAVIAKQLPATAIRPGPVR